MKSVEEYESLAIDFINKGLVPYAMVFSNLTIAAAINEGNKNVYNKA